ncbi:Gliding motility lipoprotein precursor GldH (modular protein) [Tenacibaculum litopenaei]|jgi:gliding motility-associated lipoprotein GldH|uniref:gliding motility lipoprotein GldH n=1 Tax=Tenacibaculum litopenaei TaxID=396016 RepID=UPI003894EDCE
MLRRIKRNKGLLMGFLMLSVVACDSKGVFDAYLPLSHQKWEAANTLDFSFEVNDTLSKHDLFINLRNNKDYAYSNLFVITQMDFPDGTQVIDTLEYDMATAAGEFLGKGMTDIKENKLFYKEKITFPNTGMYHFKIKQSMRKMGAVQGIEALPGVTHVGFRIEKSN